MKTFFAVFAAILCAAAVIFGVYSYRENRRLEQVKNDKFLEEFAITAAKLDSYRKTYDASQWEEHLRSIQFIRDYVNRTKLLTPEKAKEALKVADSMEEIGNVLPHPGK